MYLPTAFRDQDLTSLHAHIDAARLGIVVTQGRNGLQASHLPLLLDRSAGANGTLYGHFAKANPQWQDLADGAPVMVIFAGVDAYISPSWYPGKAEHGKVVPTWNYVAVHAYGQAEVFHEHDRLLALVSDLTDKHERPRKKPWAVADAPADFIDGMLNAIVGFALPIERLEGKRKLSQNRAIVDQVNVRDGLAASANPQDQAAAASMEIKPQ